MQVFAEQKFLLFCLIYCNGTTDGINPTYESVARKTPNLLSNED